MFDSFFCGVSVTAAAQSECVCERVVVWVCACVCAAVHYTGVAAYLFSCAFSLFMTDRRFLMLFVVLM